MKYKAEGSEKHKKGAITKVMYVAAAVTGIFAIASLINNILLFKNNVDMYTLQGYPAADVMKQLIPAQLLPGVFEAIALYGGITILLIAAAIINEKVTQCLPSLPNQEKNEETVQESAVQESAAENIDEENNKTEQPAADQENQIED